MRQKTRRPETFGLIPRQRRPVLVAAVVSDGRDTVYVWAHVVGTRGAVKRYVGRVVLGAAPRRTASQKYASRLRRAAQRLCKTARPVVAAGDVAHGSDALRNGTLVTKTATLAPVGVEKRGLPRMRKVGATPPPVPQKLALFGLAIVL